MSDDLNKLDPRHLSLHLSRRNIDTGRLPLPIYTAIQQGKSATLPCVRLCTYRLLNTSNSDSSRYIASSPWHQIATRTFSGSKSTICVRRGPISTRGRDKMSLVWVYPIRSGVRWNRGYVPPSTYVLHSTHLDIIPPCPWSMGNWWLILLNSVDPIVVLREAISEWQEHGTSGKLCVLIDIFWVCFARLLLICTECSFSHVSGTSRNLVWLS